MIVSVEAFGVRHGHHHHEHEHRENGVLPLAHDAGVIPEVELSRVG